MKVAGFGVNKDGFIIKVAGVEETKGTAKILYYDDGSYGEVGLTGFMHEDIAWQDINMERTNKDEETLLEECERYMQSGLFRQPALMLLVKVNNGDSVKYLTLACLDDADGLLWESPMDTAPKKVSVSFDTFDADSDPDYTDYMVYTGII